MSRAVFPVPNPTEKLSERFKQRSLAEKGRRSCKSPSSLSFHTKQSGRSSSELLFGRQIKSSLLVYRHLLNPTGPALKAVNKKRVRERLNGSTITIAGKESRSCNLSNLAIGCGSRQKANHLRSEHNNQTSRARTLYRSLR